MEKEIIAKLAGMFVLVSAIPYAVQTWRGVIKPNPVSWTIWSFISLSILLTYNDSEATGGFWTAFFGFVNPVAVTIITFVKNKSGIRKPDFIEVICIIIATISIVLWTLLKENSENMQYILYISIIGDMSAAIPTFRSMRRDPSSDRPFAWTMFAVGYGISIFAIGQHIFVSYVLPVYMFVGAGILSAVLISYRIKNKIPLSKWI